MQFLLKTIFLLFLATLFLTTCAELEDAGNFSLTSTNHDIFIQKGKSSVTITIPSEVKEGEEFTLAYNNPNSVIFFDNTHIALITLYGANGYTIQLKENLTLHCKPKKAPKEAIDLEDIEPIDVKKSKKLNYILYANIIVCKVVQSAHQANNPILHRRSQAQPTSNATFQITLTVFEFKNEEEMAEIFLEKTTTLSHTEFDEIFANLPSLEYVIYFKIEPKLFF